MKIQDQLSLKYYLQGGNDAERGGIDTIRYQKDDAYRLGAHDTLFVMFGND